MSIDKLLRYAFAVTLGAVVLWVWFATYDPEAGVFCVLVMHILIAIVIALIVATVLYLLYKLGDYLEKHNL